MNKTQFEATKIKNSNIPDPLVYIEKSMKEDLKKIGHGELIGWESCVKHYLKVIDVFKQNPVNDWISVGDRLPKLTGQNVYIYKWESEKTPDGRDIISKPMKKVLDGKGEFIQFGLDVSESEYGIASYTAAIVKKFDGTIYSVAADMIQFIDPINPKDKTSFQTISKLCSEYLSSETFKKWMVVAKELCNNTPTLKEV